MTTFTTVTLALGGCTEAAEPGVEPAARDSDHPNEQPPEKREAPPSGLSNEGGEVAEVEAPPRTLPRDVFYGMDRPVGCNVVAVNARGLASPIGSAPGCGCAVLLDLDAARLAWIREAHSGHELVVRRVDGQPGPIQVLGAASQHARLAIVDGHIASSADGRLSVWREEREDIALPTTTDFVGSDAWDSPCVVSREKAGHVLSCLRDGEWTPQPAGHGQFGRLIDGGAAASWWPLQFAKCAQAGRPWTPIGGADSRHYADGPRCQGCAAAGDQCQASAGRVIEVSAPGSDSSMWSVYHSWDGTHTAARGPRLRLTSSSPDGNLLLVADNNAPSEVVRQAWRTALKDRGACGADPYPQRVILVDDLALALRAGDATAIPAPPVQGALLGEVTWR